MLFGKYQVPVSLAPSTHFTPSTKCTSARGLPLPCWSASPRGRHAGPSPPGRLSGSPVGPFSSLRNKRAASDSLKFLIVSRPWCKGSFEQFVREI